MCFFNRLLLYQAREQYRPETFVVTGAYHERGRKRSPDSWWLQGAVAGQQELLVPPPGAPPFKELLRESGLRESSRGRGLLPTWPTFQPLFWIPIDHCLHTADLRVTRKTLGPKVGSDHYPLMIDFALTSPASSAHQPPPAIPPRR